jgi:hypothetical protein
MRWVEHVAYLGGEKLIQEFGGETPKTGKKLTWKTRRRWEGVTEVEQETGWGGED